MPDTTQRPGRDDRGRRNRRAADPARRPTPQRDLFSQDVDAVGGTHRERAAAFMADNPAVLRRFVRIALDLQAAGHAKYGAKAIWEILRYQLLHTRGDAVKLNNNHTSYVAEAAEAAEPRLAGFFTHRRKGGTD